MAIRVESIIKAIETVAPRKIAESWDNVGLQLGERNQEVQRILLTLDVTEAVIAEAIEKEVELIVSHHPFIFSGLKSLSCDSLKGRMIKALIKNNISVYAAHTNLDKAEQGLNDYVAKKLGLSEVVSLEEAESEKYFKFVVFVPETHQKIILETLGKNHAGELGVYDNCTFSAAGTGRFRPLEGADPFIGEKGQVETVKEVRIETLVKEKDAVKLVKQVKKVHPYEVMAYDLYALENKLGPEHGLGKIGKLEAPLSADEWIRQLKNSLELDKLTGAGKMPDRVKKVALCTGSGADLLPLAKACKADVLVTGDLKYHDGQRAEELGIWVLDAGHFGTEKFAPECLEEILIAELGAECPILLKARNSADFLKVY